MLVTIKAKEFDAVDRNEHLRIMTTFPELISTFEIDHREAFRNYLLAKGYDVNEETGSINGQKAINRIKGEFDPQGRLTNMTS